MVVNSLRLPALATNVMIAPMPRALTGEAAASYPLPTSPSEKGSRQFTLEWLLDPITPAAFVAHHWEKTALFVNREDPGYFASLPGLEAIDEIITATSSHSSRPADDLRIVRTDRDDVLAERSLQSLPNGMPDIQSIYREYQNGCTVVINHLHRRSASVALLCSKLEADLHHPVGANLYLTPRGAQGFRAHFDTHDVFILQLHGIKDWYVASALHALPLASMKQGAEESSHEFRRLTLRPGDILYLPRGFVHYAKTQPSSSLHLTVRIEVYRWIDLMSEALRELAEEHAEFRNALPPGFLDVSLNVARVSELTEGLVRSMRDPAFVERAKVRLGTRLLDASKAASTSQFASLDAASDLTIDSTVMRSPGLFCRVRHTSDAAMIEFTGNFVSGPVFLEPALKFVAEHERFTVRDLPGDLSPADKIDLVVRMIHEGLLRLPSNASLTTEEARR